MGKVLLTGGVQQKVRAAFDAGVKEVQLPTHNLQEAQGLPAYITQAVRLTPVQSIAQVLRRAPVGRNTP